MNATVIAGQDVASLQAALNDFLQNTQGKGGAPVEVRFVIPNTALMLTIFWT